MSLNTAEYLKLKKRFLDVMQILRLAA